MLDAKDTFAGQDLFQDASAIASALGFETIELPVGRLRWSQTQTYSPTTKIADKSDFCIAQPPLK